MKNRSLIDEGMDAIFDLEQVVKHIDERLEELYGKLYNLSEFTSPENFKPYDELKAKLNRVLGVDAGVSESEPTFDSAPSVTMNEVTTESPSDNSNDEDDTLSYFAKLANES